MSVFNLARYPLGADGAIHHWLACGLVTSPIDELIHGAIPSEGDPFGPNGRWILNYWAWDEHSIALKGRVYEQLPLLDWTPGERPFLNAKGIGGEPWRYVAVEEDAAVDFSRFNFTPTLMRGWTYAGLQLEQPTTAPVELLTIGPARVYLNGELVTHYKDRFSYVALQAIPLTLDLKAGFNDLYLQSDMLGWREARLALGLRFVAAPPVTVCLPLGGVSAELWHAAEDGLSRLQVRQFAFTKLPGHVSLAADAPGPVTFDVEVVAPVPENLHAALGFDTAPTGRTRLTLHPGERAELPITREVAEAMATLPGENVDTLIFRPADGTPIEREVHIWAGSGHFSTEPYGDYDGRLREAMAHLAAMPLDIFASMAAVELGQSEQIDSEAVRLGVRFMNDRFDCADFYAIGLLSLLYRYGDHPALKSPDRDAIEAAFKGFKFWLDEPGLDAMCYFTENHQVLFQVVGYLAGQRWPTWVFTNSGYTGHEQMERQRPRIEAWILRRLKGSFSEWDSNAYLALDAYAMLALIEYANSPRLREMATALMHKIFFVIAAQSFRGSHGSTHGRCYVIGLKSARVENTSTLQRIAWGTGLFNGETRATGLLTLAKRYRVPEVIQKIGADVPDLLVTRARSLADYDPRVDMRGGQWDARTITYRTPDAMLAAAVDLLPGSMGIQEHLWQATLGPEAVVFTTYPGNSQEHGNARPNFWSGSARLPRVAMHDRTVICLYRFEPGVGLGLSHAYFPAAEFDEWRIDGPWAFGRAGNGYVALRGDGDLVMTESGRHAGQELRSLGAGQVWISTVGRAAVDGAFASFCARLQATPFQSEGDSVRYTTPDGESLAFAWTGPLTVDDAAQDWDHFPHYDNAYTHTSIDADRMTLTCGGESLTLNLVEGRVE